MNETILTPILDILDVVGIALFALSGAVIAAQLRQTFVTMGFFALVTGVGGGTVRDLLIDAPVFWMQDGLIAPVCLISALIVWLTPVKWWQGRLFDYADGAGLAAFTVLGSAKALAYGVPPVPAMLMGVVTGIVGGIIRDAVAGRASIIVEPQLYVTAAALSAVVTVVGMNTAPLIGLSQNAVWAGAFLAGFALRAAAIEFELCLPSYGRGEDVHGSHPEYGQGRELDPGPITKLSAKDHSSGTGPPG